MTPNPVDTLRSFDLGDGRQGRLHSLPALEEAGLGPVSRLPVSLRIVLEAVVRNVDGRKVTWQDVAALARWNAKAPARVEIPFVVARILLQDFTGVPLLVDLAAMRSTVARMGRDPGMIEPLVPVDLVVDHSVQVDFFGSPDALQRNLELEFKRNRERYQLLKWGRQAFRTFRVVPPGVGIVHQVNLERLARGVIETDGIHHPDTLVGTDSHTTMINGLGVVGWGVGGIEAEAGMLGQPVSFQTPQVIGVHFTGALREGITATDLVLHVTQMLRRAKVVGKFVEFFGPGVASLPVADRATIANMAPEYGATMGFFPIDAQTVAYLRETAREEERCRIHERYFRAQGLWGVPVRGQIDYSDELDLDLGTITPSVAGPRRPQDRIELSAVKAAFQELLARPVHEGGYGRPWDPPAPPVALQINGVPPEAAPMPSTDSHEEPVDEGAPTNKVEMVSNRPSPTPAADLPDTSYRFGEVRIGDGSVLIAAITSCTNTSNARVMLAAGLVAKKAVERGLRVDASVKTSLAPGSRAVADYLRRTGLQPFLDALGFQVVGFGCTTCIGNSGALHPRLEDAIRRHDLVVASVLSGNRNFEARVHPSIKANFLMSPPLVVAYALAGRIDVDLTREPIGTGTDGAPVHLRDLWPTPAELAQAMTIAAAPDIYRRNAADSDARNPMWDEIPAPEGASFAWDPASTYIQEPPFFQKFSMEADPVADVRNARALAIFGDSVTTDHISPAGAILPDSPAGQYLLDHGVAPEDFNSYGSRRGNDRVMTRGTFANVRLRNLMVPGIEGGWTRHLPDGEVMTIHQAAIRYEASHIPLVILAGHEYGTGSSRDWAAKGTKLLGVRAVIARSFERIHRSNLVGVGVLPLQFQDGASAATFGLDGTEVFTISGLADGIEPGGLVTLHVQRASGEVMPIDLRCRIDTAVELDYYRHGGILHYVLRQLLGSVPDRP